MEKSGSILRGALLVSGTSIGGGMLALPLLTSLGGFVPSLFIYLLCSVFMMATGLLVLETFHWVDEQANLLSMAEKTLGRFGRLFAWGIYLFLFYSLTLAYVAGCGDLLYQLSGGTISKCLGSILFVAAFAPIVFAGARSVSRVNLWLMVGLITTFVLFVCLGFSYVDAQNLQPRNWPLSIVAMPVAFTAFAYQGVIPSLSRVMEHNVGRTIRAIIFGCLITLTTYIIWQWLVLGIVSPGSLAQSLQAQELELLVLNNWIESPYVAMLGQAFMFFAITTSFFGVNIGLVDFLADGLKIKKTTFGKLLLSFLVFVPPTIVACLYPDLFLKALEAAGGVGCALLLGLLPILMVWSGRYRLGLPKNPLLPGGRFTLVLLLLFVLFELALECSSFIPFFS